MTADAGITKNVSFHTSRHTFAVLTLAAGSDLYTVGKLLGHTSINSTQVYADVV
ncbi:MAG: tyrosine-type recombinase/integrase, partial [Prevotella sp.]|nr:tyrosine-type recombinase/integrase [Prevotella sp.]